MKKTTRFLVFCVVLVLCSSYAFSFVVPKGFSKPLVEEQPMEAEESKTKSKNSTETTSTSQNSSKNSEPAVTVMSVDDVASFLDGKKILLPSEIEEIKKANAKVGEDIEELKKELKKEATGTKYFMDFGVASGFREGDKLHMGLAADFGIRVWKGLTLKLGGIYMIGDMDTIANISDKEWSASDATVTATVGWEF